MPAPGRHRPAVIAIAVPHEGHALVLQTHAREIHVANPFSAVPIDYRVFADRRWWYANCAWDAFGMCCSARRRSHRNVARGLRSANHRRGARWAAPTMKLCYSTAWSRRCDGGTTLPSLAMMNLFRAEEHITQWLGTRVPGATISVTKLSEMAHAWWGDRIDPNWQPHTREQNQAILNGLGLRDSFWSLSSVSRKTLS